MVHDSAGNIYGIASSGSIGWGMIYKLDTSGTATVLHTFTDGSDGGEPTGLTIDPAGNLYGTAALGGVYGEGTVFKLDLAGVILDPAGNLYGANNGGADEEGVIYKLDASGNFTLLFTFNYTDGAYPNALIRDSAGNLFGSTANGTSSEAGLVCMLDPAGKQTVLYQFVGRTNGSNPAGPPIRDSYGNLYGTASVGGEEEGGPGFGYLGGVVFEIKVN